MSVMFWSIWFPADSEPHIGKTDKNESRSEPIIRHRAECGEGKEDRKGETWGLLTPNRQGGPGGYDEPGEVSREVF